MTLDLDSNTYKALTARFSMNGMRSGGLQIMSALLQMKFMKNFHKQIQQGMLGWYNPRLSLTSCMQQPVYNINTG